MRRISLSLIFLCSCLGFAHPQLDDYAPGAKFQQEGAALANPERQAKRDLGHSPPSLRAANDFVRAAIFIHPFVKFDRKQNTRLWLFLTVGETRAPPARFPFGLLS